jgi:hypothetical protein
MLSRVNVAGAWRTETLDSTLLIDQRSVSLAASQRDIGEWASGRRVFASSLVTHMPTERVAVRGALGNCRCHAGDVQGPGS